MKSFKQFIIETDKKDTITFDIPLLIRVLEFAREDIKTDVELHKVVERLIDIRDRGVLTMDDYNFITHLKENYLGEDGMGAGAVSGGPSNTVAGVASTGDSRLPTSQREPGVSKKRKSPVMMGFRRKPPKM